MCGLVGYAGAFDQERLNAALQRIVHRGPDDSGSWLDHAAQIALGHRRLSIIDLSSAGHQPMISADGSAVLSYNGEIYNFRELRAELELKGFQFRSHSDTEVVLALYLTEGESMLGRLNGIFAFALWDARSQSLLLARDALGVKPLYYAQTQQGVAFASEIKALLALEPHLGGISNLDARAIHRYLSFLWCPGEGTPLRSVHKLEPGEAIVVKHARIARRWLWYRLPAQRGVLADQDEASAINGTTRHVRQAVHRQMQADVPVGAFLSGGLDSSAVVAFAREIDPKVRCFTIELAGGQETDTVDDLPYARAVARHLGVALEVVQMDSKQMASDLPMLVGQLDEPVVDPAALNVLYISRLARQHGIKVLLSGAGGDDLFSGYRRHRALHAERYWAWLPQGVRAALRLGAAKIDRRDTLGRRVAKAFAGADLSSEKRIVDYFLWANPNTLVPLYSSSFLEKLRGEAAEAPMLTFLASMPADLPRLERMLALEQRFFLSDHNLIYTDRMSMAAGVEVRVPFLDLDLVNFAARIPSPMKQRGSVGKWVLKKAMEPYLPRHVIYRPKTGFGAPLRRWLRHELRDFMRDLLKPDVLARRGFFEPSAVQRMIVANESGALDATYTLFALMSVELWCRQYVDAPTTNR
jgi:asparagine synthase (glutamine-hydrolysing)